MKSSGLTQLPLVLTTGTPGKSKRPARSSFCQAAHFSPTQQQECSSELTKYILVLLLEHVCLLCYRYMYSKSLWRKSSTLLRSWAAPVCLTTVSSFHFNTSSAWRLSSTNTIDFCKLKRNFEFSSFLHTFGESFFILQISHCPGTRCRSSVIHCVPAFLWNQSCNKS